MPNNELSEYKLLVQLEMNECIDSRETRDFYDDWSETYEEDIVNKLDYRSPQHMMEHLVPNFIGNRETALVLDVACGSGLVAKLMVEVGFKNFVGVDGSSGMLKQAARTGLYSELHQNLLGAESLSVESETFDLVTLVGGMDVGFIPVSAARELCRAAKPGGYICICRGHHKGETHLCYRQDLEAELALMEQEGLLSHVATKLVQKYMQKKRVDSSEKEYIDGAVYLYQKM